MATDGGTSGRSTPKAFTSRTTPYTRDAGEDHAQSSHSTSAHARPETNLSTQDGGGVTRAETADTPSTASNTHFTHDKPRDDAVEIDGDPTSDRNVNSRAHENTPGNDVTRSTTQHPTEEVSSSSSILTWTAEKSNVTLNVTPEGAEGGPENYTEGATNITGRIHFVVADPYSHLLHNFWSSDLF